MSESKSNLIIEGSSSAVGTVDEIMLYAARVGASDIHMDPTDGRTTVRLRIDGQLESAGSFDKRLHEEIIARLKILSAARTDIHSVPQDGRFKANLNGKVYNIRVSFMPTYHGENCVIRLLGASHDTKDSFASLGFTPDHVRMIERALRSSHGMILVTGPTGSGKTTTLRTCLSLKAAEPISVMTLEDPVEYEVPGVRHVHIRSDFGVSFASGLRSALRQDPDVIMVGEIRDGETANTAINTALTGHLVLSTLHTNSAIETILRLSQMGVPGYLLAATLRLVVSQRLVRVICPECEGWGELCDRCRSTGFIGRSVVSEVLEIDEGMRDLIAQGGQVASISLYAESKGFHPISYDGDEKVDWGVTTQAEVMRALNS